MPKKQDLSLLPRRGPSGQSQPTRYLHAEEVHETQAHDRKPWPSPPPDCKIDRELTCTDGILGNHNAYGSPPYGRQSVDRELADKPGEAEHLDQMRAWHMEGAGIREITRRLNAAGIPTKRGGAWHPNAVARLLNEEARARDRHHSARNRDRNGDPESVTE